MARMATFKLDGEEYSCSMTKLDRDKLYGWKEKKALDESGHECIKGSIDQGGGICIPPGGKALGMLDQEGRWVEKSLLKAIDTRTGNDAPLVPGIYDELVILTQTATLDEFLDHSIEYIYILESETITKLAEKIRQTDDFYTFNYNYRADYEGTPAFLVENNGKVFILAGFKVDIPLSSPEIIAIAETASDTESEEIDFNMI